MLGLKQLGFVSSYNNHARMALFAVGKRQASTAVQQDQIQQSQPVSAVEKAKVKLEELENPNLVQKIILRFKGVPLKGEAQRPMTMFENLGMYHIYEPLPKVPKDFKEYPERDLVNFPHPEKLMYPSKVRLFFVPDSWCRAIEKVTGTSGPYLFIGAIFAFLLNKEILVIDKGMVWLCLWWGPAYFLLNAAIRLRLEKFCYKMYRERIAKLKGFISSDLSDAVEFRKWSKEQADSLKAAHENFPTIFQENLALQLEAAYRKNVDYAWQELKRRLDYLQEVQAIKDRFMREVLIDQITQGVRKQIESNEGGIRDKYMDQCIEQLRVLAPK